LNKKGEKLNSIFKTSLVLLKILLLQFLISGNANCQELLYTENFDKFPDGTPLPPGWWVEGNPSVSIQKGHLLINANPEAGSKEYSVSTVWLNKMFEGNLQIEFDAHIIKSRGEKNNINLFILYSDTTNMPLYESRESRSDGRYPHYHKLNGYIFTYLANGQPDTARFRLRDNPGFFLLQENYAYECRAGKTYHMTVIKIGNKLSYSVDGNTYLEFLDNQLNPLHHKGLIGFRTFQTELWWDNLRVTRVK
jgi:hypothetical protein